METSTYKIEMGALVDVPLYESHNRGHNWAASIRLSPKSPGGFDRDFWERAKGDYYYLVPADLEPGTPIEFGGDYYTGGGKKNMHRWYGVVLAVDETNLVCVKTDSGRDAVESAAALLANYKLEQGVEVPQETDKEVPLDGGQHYVLPDSAPNVWIAVGPIRVYIKRTDEGVTVNLYSSAADESLASTHAEFD